MPSPFPGMDPYLEDDKLWPGFQHHLVHALHQLLLPGLMDRYRARISQRHYVSEQALFTSVIREEHTEALIEIRQRSDGRLITLLEVMSPANKLSDAGRQAYLARRHEAKGAKANLVEVDLVRCCVNAHYGSGGSRRLACVPAAARGPRARRPTHRTGSRGSSRSGRRFRPAHPVPRAR